VAHLGRIEEGQRVGLPGGQPALAQCARVVRLRQAPFVELADGAAGAVEALAQALGGAGGGGLLSGLLGNILNRGGVAGQGWTGSGDMDLPSFAVGTDYVPRDMIARIHQGERIVPAAQNRGGAGGVTINQVVNIDSRSDQASIRAAMAQAKQETMAAILDSRNRGGAFA
jgi:hypothetical protein